MAIAVEVPELGTELAGASPGGDAGRRLDLVEPRRLRVLGFGVRPLIVIDEKSIPDAHELIDSPVTVEIRVMWVQAGAVFRAVEDHFGRTELGRPFYPPGASRGVRTWRLAERYQRDRDT
jgi:hypothetical protein